MHTARFSWCLVGKGVCLGGVRLGGGGACPRRAGCEQNDWQTGVKTLPCPKLRLQAVKMWKRSKAPLTKTGPKTLRVNKAWDLIDLVRLEQIDLSFHFKFNRFKDSAGTIWNYCKPLFWNAFSGRIVIEMFKGRYAHVEVKWRRFYQL